MRSLEDARDDLLRRFGPVLLPVAGPGVVECLIARPKVGCKHFARRVGDDPGLLDVTAAITPPTQFDGDLIPILFRDGARQSEVDDHEIQRRPDGGQRRDPSSLARTLEADSERPRTSATAATASSARTSKFCV